MTTSTDTLAIHGGEPVRTTPFPRGRGIELLGEEEIDQATEVLRKHALFRYAPTSLGKVTRVEDRLISMFGVDHALALSSGTAALYSGLVALGVQEGDEVIVPAVTFVATIGAVVMARAVPIFAEVDESLTLDPTSVAASVTERTKAVVPVHLDNVAADMDPLLAVTRRYDIPVFEDAAQAAGVTYHDAPVGSFGAAAELSFQQGKNITCGEGGALLTSDWTVYDRALRFHDQGGQFTTATGSRTHSSGEPFLGMNLRMTELSAAVLLGQLDRLDHIVTTCRRHARRIRAELADLPMTWRRIPDEDGEGGSVMFFLDNAETASRFTEALVAEGIPAGQMYNGKPVYANPAVLAGRTAWDRGSPFHSGHFDVGRQYRMGMCPRSEDLFGRCVVIGVGPAMTDTDTEQIVVAVRKVARHLL
jgi:8-amino-3,8-dideoxy-alpha-D-manno-octulosonate transaminase